MIWTRTVVGVYRVTPSGGLDPSANCVLFYTQDRGTIQDETLRIGHTNTYIQVAVKDGTGTLTDSLLSARIEIRVY